MAEMQYSDAAYIYAIRNTKNGRAYIGSTVDYRERFWAHRSYLRSGGHHSFILQRAWDKHGEAAFEFKVLFVCPKAMRDFYEMRAFALADYNVNRTAKQILVRGGWHHTEEHKQKMSSLFKGRIISAEQRAKLSAASTGKKRGQAFREKCRARQLGWSPSDATRAKLGEKSKAAWAASVEKNNALTKSVYDAYDGSVSIIAMCKEAGLGIGTFYTACKRLQLPPPKHVAKRHKI